MKQYYVYDGNQQTGPFTFDILKNRHIKNDTLIWHEGLTDWTKANEVEELKAFLNSTPPPLPVNNAATVPNIPNIHTQPDSLTDIKKPTRIFGIRKNIFIYSILGIAFIICISAFTSHSKKEKEEEAKRDLQIDISNQLLKEQQIAIEEQNRRIAEQERLEKERKEKERLERINEINTELTTAYQNLEQAKRKLNNVSAFKFLRSSEERHQQVSAAEETIKSLETEIETLEKEMTKINP